MTRAARSTVPSPPMQTRSSVPGMLSATGGVGDELLVPREHLRRGDRPGGDAQRRQCAAGWGGEADAGIAYQTDVTAAGDRADGDKIPPDINVVAEYPIAVTKQAPNSAAAQAFVDFVLSEQGQQVLASFGFLPPD